MALIVGMVLLGVCFVGGALLGRRGRPVSEAPLLSGLLALVIVIATPVAAWWLIGDLSESSRGGRYQLDYMLRAPEIPGWIVALLGAIALVAAVTCAGFLVHAAKLGTLDQRWLFAVGCLAVAGVLIACMGRVFTAGTHGANIGGGMAILVGLPVVIALVGFAAVRGYRIRGS